MLSRQELIEKAEALLTRATENIENEGVSAAHVANELAAARLFFDMADCGWLFPVNAYTIEYDDQERFKPDGIIVLGGGNG